MSHICISQLIQKWIYCLNLCQIWTIGSVDFRHRSWCLESHMTCLAGSQILRSWPGIQLILSYIIALSMITISLHHGIATSLLHCTSVSLLDCSTVSLFHCLTASLVHCITMSIHHYFTASLHHSIIALLHLCIPASYHQHYITLPLLQCITTCLPHCAVPSDVSAVCMTNGACKPCWAGSAGSNTS